MLFITKGKDTHILQRIVRKECNVKSMKIVNDFVLNTCYLAFFVDVFLK